MANAPLHLRDGHPTLSRPPHLPWCRQLDLVRHQVQHRDFRGWSVMFTARPAANRILSLAQRPPFSATSSTYSVGEDFQGPGLSLPQTCTNSTLSSGIGQKSRQKVTYPRLDISTASVRLGTRSLFAMVACLLHPNSHPPQLQ